MATYLPQTFDENTVQKEGYIIEASELSEGAESELKTASDGHTILIPQPSDDPNDPLNWTWFKKHAFLAIVSIVAFLPDYTSSVGAITNLVQPLEWHLPITTINHALVGNIFMLGAGGLFVVALSAYFGRLPVLFWFSVIAFLTSIWCAVATSFESFMTARILIGFFSTVAQSGGLMFIKDMFFLHEHPRKINIWSAFIILSPYLGPFTASFIIWKTTWRWVYRMIVILWALALLLVVFFMDETYYNRKIARFSQPPRRSRFFRLLGIEQWQSRHQRNTFLQAVKRPVVVIMKLPVLITITYYMFTFAWVIGINTTTGVFLQEVYGFGSVAMALFYFAPIVATILGELAGHYLFDFTAAFYISRHHGHLSPEIRLLPIAISTPLMISGIILLGFSLQRAWHYMVTAVAWGMFVFGIMITTTACNAYLLDAYPEASGEVAAWINFGRSLGGFVITYYEVNWTKSWGTGKALAVQGGVVAAAAGFILILGFWGKRLRVWQGSVGFATD